MKARVSVTVSLLRKDFTTTATQKRKHVVGSLIAVSEGWSSTIVGGGMGNNMVLEQWQKATS